MNSSKPFASFEQDTKDIPPVLRYGLMNPEIHNYYSHLHDLLEKKGLLVKGACVYPGMGPDVSTIPTLFWTREIIWFDHAGLYPGAMKWYDVQYLNKIKDELSTYNTDEAIKTISDQCHGEWYKRKKNQWGYQTTDLINGDNSRLLLIELLSLWIPLSTIQFEEEIRDDRLECIHISFANNIHPDIYIYQADILDKTYEEHMETVMKRHQPTHYIEKTGENIIEFDSFPLKYMTNNPDTEVLVLWHNYRKTKIVPPVHLREILTQTDTSWKNHTTDLSDMVAVMIAKNLSSLGQEMSYGKNNHYRWALDIYKRNK